MKSFYKELNGCYARLENGVLSVGNEIIERSYDMIGERPVVKSLTDKRTMREWLTDTQGAAAHSEPCKRPAFLKAGIVEGSMTLTGMDATEDDDFGIGQRHMRVTVHLSFEAFSVEWIHIVYPSLPILRSGLRAVPKAEISLMQAQEESSKKAVDYIDCMPFAPEHIRWESVTFYDRTDDNDNLVFTNHGLCTRREERAVKGNLLFAEDSIAGGGVLLVKEGPTPFAYQGGMTHDFEIRGMTLYASGWGFTPDECARANGLSSYLDAVILWNGDRSEAFRALHSYHRAVRRYMPKRDALVMANTWGDGSADGRISEKFLLDELKRAHDLGIDFYQIDDGWEQGTTCNSVNAAAVDQANGGNTVWGMGYYKADPNFWAVNKERFPNGLEPIADYAREQGIRLGLWFSPDSLNDFENWRRDSDVILNLYRRYGVKAFKMDGLRFTSKLGEENFVRFAQRVVEESNGEILFNIDTTTSRRNGYFGRIQYGSLFLENRFTNRFGWWPNYWPHLTLRNLWSLSRYMTTEKLQIEFLNVYRNEALYGGDPLAPAACGIEYAFAVTLFATPLVWMELTGLNDQAAKAVKDMLAVYHRIQPDILSGFVQPIGEEPDGTGWTGFQSEKDEKNGYVIVFREFNQRESAKITLNGLKGKTLSLTPLMGSGAQSAIQLDADGAGIFSLDKPLSFSLYKYRAE